MLTQLVGKLLKRNQENEEPKREESSVARLTEEQKKVIKNMYFEESAQDYGHSRSKGILENLCIYFEGNKKLRGHEVAAIVLSDQSLTFEPHQLSEFENYWEQLIKEEYGQ